MIEYFCPKCKKRHLAPMSAQGQSQECECGNVNTVPKVEVPPIKCSRCGSTQIGAGNKGFSLGKAAVGGVLLGPVGLLGGLWGSKETFVVCLNCGHRWNANNPNVITRVPSNPNENPSSTSENKESRRETKSPNSSHSTQFPNFKKLRTEVLKELEENKQKTSASQQTNQKILPKNDPTNDRSGHTPTQQNPARSEIKIKDARDINPGNYNFMGCPEYIPTSEDTKDKPQTLNEPPSSEKKQLINMIVRCPSCRALYSIKPEMQNRMEQEKLNKIRCKKCQTVFDVDSNCHR